MGGLGIGWLEILILGAVVLVGGFLLIYFLLGGRSDE